MAAAGVFGDEATVFFVGALGAKTGDADAGGVTKATWLADPTLATYIGTDGAAKYEDEGGSYATATGIVTLSADIIPSNDAVNGFVVHITGAALTNGYYKITDSTGGAGTSTITIDAGLTDDADVDTWIGGALDTLQHAADFTDAENYDVFILTNKNETLGGDAIGIDTGMPDPKYGVGKFVIGFNTTAPSNTDLTDGDMDYGGAYYQNALDAYVNGVTAGYSVKLDGNNGAHDIITITGHNLTLRNLYIYQTDGAATNDGVVFSGNCFNPTIKNCKFDDLYTCINGTTYRMIIEDTYFGPLHGNYYQITSPSYGGSVSNCVFEGKAAAYIAAMAYISFDNCIFIGGYYGIYTQVFGHVSNCIFYNQTTACLGPNSTTQAYIKAHNCIFMPAATADYAVYGLAKGGVHVGLSTHNQIWSVAGADLTNHISINGNTRQFPTDTNAVGDPLFVDAANGDFRLKPTSPCLNTGRPIPADPVSAGTNDGYANKGAWQRKSILRYKENG